MTTPDSTDAQDVTDTSDEVVAAIGKASEALEYVERARGHLYSFHQLMGRADILFEEAAGLLSDAGLADDARRMQDEIVGRNVLDGRWTFQVVEEYEDLYYRPAEAEVRNLEAVHLQGRRHVHEARMKQDRRTAGRAGHEDRPPAAHTSAVVMDGRVEA